MVGILMIKLNKIIKLDNIRKYNHILIFFMKGTKNNIKIKIWKIFIKIKFTSIKS